MSHVDALIYGFLKDEGFNKIADKFRKIQNPPNYQDDVKLSRIVENYFNFTHLNSYFKDQFRSEISRFDGENCEIGKVLRFIFKKDLRISKSALKGAIWRPFVRHGKNARLRNDAETKRKHVSGIRYGRFTSREYGESSEEVLMVQMWQELIEKVPILDPLGLLKYLDQNPISWHWSVIGLFLSQHFKLPRYAVMVVQFLLQKNCNTSGKFSEEEDEKILKHLSIYTRPKYGILCEELGRSKNSIAVRIKSLRRGQSNSVKRTKVTEQEDGIILQNVFAHGLPQTFEDLRDMKTTGLKHSATELNRPYGTILNRWSSVIKPTLMAHLLGCFGQQTLKKDIFEFIVESKASSFSDINWTKMSLIWPFITRNMVYKFVKNLDPIVKDTGKPLYQRILDNKSKLYVDGFQAKWYNERRSIIDSFESLKNKTILV